VLSKVLPSGSAELAAVEVARAAHGAYTDSASTADSISDRELGVEDVTSTVAWPGNAFVRSSFHVRPLLRVKYRLSPYATHPTPGASTPICETASGAALSAGTSSD
jgi:hypothetical protein